MHGERLKPQFRNNIKEYERDARGNSLTGKKIEVSNVLISSTNSTKTSMLYISRGPTVDDDACSFIHHVRKVALKKTLEQGK